MEHDVLDAEVVLLARVRRRERAKLLREGEAAADILRRDEILGDFNRRAQVVDLMRAARRYEYGLPLPLHEAVAAHATEGQGRSGKDGDVRRLRTCTNR